MNSATPGKRLMQSSKSTKQSAQSCAISPSPLVITVMNEFKQMHWTNARERRTHPTQLVSMHVYLQTWHREDILWKDSCKTWNQLKERAQRVAQFLLPLWSSQQRLKCDRSKDRNRIQFLQLSPKRITHHHLREPQHKFQTFRAMSHLNGLVDLSLSLLH